MPAPRITEKTTHIDEKERGEGAEPIFDEAADARTPPGPERGRRGAPGAAPRPAEHADDAVDGAGLEEEVDGAPILLPDETLLPRR